jgi:Protein of unknown function (DUF3775)
LTWLGRRNGDIKDGAALRPEAARVHNRRTASYLLGMPQLSDFLQDGLADFEGSFEEFEMGHL